MARLPEHGPRRLVPGLFATAYGNIRGLLRGADGIHYVERPPDFEELGYRNALVPIFGDDVSAAAISRAAKLIGKGGVVYAVFVLPVPFQLSLEAGLEEEEAQGRSVLESARIQARRAGAKIHTGLIRTRNPGAALVEEALRLHSDVIYWSTLHAPAGERRIGPTAVYLLGKRPCRVIIETEGISSASQRARLGDR
jgi:basic amino acid/polyamine antiporter, APA family